MFSSGMTLTTKCPVLKNDDKNVQQIVHTTNNVAEGQDAGKKSPATGEGNMTLIKIYSSQQHVC